MPVSGASLHTLFYDRTEGGAIRMPTAGRVATNMQSATFNGEAFAITNNCELGKCDFVEAIGLVNPGWQSSGAATSR